MFSFEQEVALKTQVGNQQAFPFLFLDPLKRKVQCFIEEHHLLQFHLDFVDLIKSFHQVVAGLHSVEQVGWLDLID